MERKGVEWKKEMSGSGSLEIKATPEKGGFERRDVESWSRESFWRAGLSTGVDWPRYR